MREEFSKNLVLVLGEPVAVETNDLRVAGLDAGFSTAIPTARVGTWAENCSNSSIASAWTHVS